MHGLYLLWWVQEKQVSPAIVAAILAAGDSALVCLELPTGWFADRVGHRASLIVGSGGNVVWITRPTRGESHYYAHLDRQLVTAGTYVQEGDVIGLVGNTGNARGTAPHLHCGIYTASGPVDPLPYMSAPSPKVKPSGPRRRA